MNDAHDLTVDQIPHETQSCSVDGHHLPTDHSQIATHRSCVCGHHLAGSQDLYDTQERNAASHHLTVSQLRAEIQARHADGHHLPTDQCYPGTHSTPVGGLHLTASHTPPGIHVPCAAGHHLPTDQLHPETQPAPVGGHHLAVPPDQPPNASPRTHKRCGDDGWGELRICADLLHRAQQERIAVGNLLRTSDRDLFGPHLAQLEATEHAARLMLRRCYRRVVPASLKALQKTEAGLGEDSFARILGHLGDPYIATPHWWEGTGTNRTLMVGEPYVRTISQLWQYCGHGAPGRVAKGMTADQLAGLGNPTLKMLVHLQAEFCMKQKGRYRLLYEAIRGQVEDKVHSIPCVRCGPSGKPAQEGTPWAKGHQHAHALRVLGKELLRDMWLARHAEVNG